jgi:L-amino acid N-acyltransferase YncA
LKKIIRGKNFNLVRFKEGDEKLYDLIHSIFNEEIVKGFINPEYLKFKSKSKVVKWVDSKVSLGCEVWYVVRSKGKYAGYICYKTRQDCINVCELSIVLARGFRGFDAGLEVTKILIDYLVSSKLFGYIIAYANNNNKLAEKLLKKLGFRKTNSLHREITNRLYSGEISPNINLNFNLFSISIK